MTLRSCCTLLTIALTPALTASQAAPTRPPDAQPAADAVKALEHRVEAALVAADARFLESVVADDFLFASADGVTFRKAEWLKEFVRPGHFVSRALTAVHVEPHGDVALTKGRIEVKTSSQSQYTVCYVRLYAQRSGRWNLVSHHTFRELMGSFAETCAPREDPERSKGTITVAGVPLRYVREGNGPAVVAIGSAVYYPKAYSAGLRQKLDLIFVDARHFVPGYQPSREELAQITLETFADDLDAVRQQLGVERWAVMGHSIHAQIAIAYAVKYPERTSQLIIVAGMPFQGAGDAADSFFETHASADRKAALKESTRDLDALLNATPPARRFAVGYKYRAARYWANPRFDASGLLEGLETGPSFSRLQAVALTREQVRHALARIKAPTLVVLGKLDYAVPYVTWDGLTDGLSNVTMKLLETDGHNPQTESPDRFDPILLEFLAKAVKGD